MTQSDAHRRIVSQVEQQQRVSDDVILGALREQHELDRKIR
jgi:hypothetical protein